MFVIWPTVGCSCTQPHFPVTWWTGSDFLSRKSVKLSSPQCIAVLQLIQQEFLSRKELRLLFTCCSFVSRPRQAAAHETKLQLM